MFSFCCGDSERKPTAPTQIKVLFSRHQAQTGRYEQKIAKFESGKVDLTHAEWKRMKFKTRDYNKAKKQSYFNNFIDEEFPHNNSSISDEQLDTMLEWKRIPDIIKMPIYATADTCSNFERIAMTNKVLKQALIFMQRTHPNKFKQLLSHEFCEQGIYQFKLYYKGIIENVVIDDYVPVVGGKFPFATGPIKDRQIFPMVLQKAIAKICGAYDKVPTDVDEILQIIFCGPLRKTKISELSDRDYVVKTIEDALVSNGVGGFISKKQSKIRSFGINENELYSIVNYYIVYLQNNHEKLYLIELVSEKKLVAWNGKYSHNDSAWDHINATEKKKIFKSLKDNKSFCIAARDIPRIFDNLIIFDGTENYNKDWIQHMSEVTYPSFCQFELLETDTILLRQCTKDTVRTSMILAKVVGTKNYSYETGAFHHNTQSVQICKQLTPGKYIVCLFHDWILNKTENYSLFLSSNQHTSLTRAQQNLHPNFLENLFKSHSQTMRSKAQTPEYYHWNKFYSICEFSGQNGFSYLYIQIKDCKKKELRIEINQKILMNDKWELLEPHKGRNQIVLDHSITPEIIFILKAHHYLGTQKVFFPSTGFVIEN